MRLKKSQYLLVPLIILCSFQCKAQNKLQESFLTDFIASIQYLGWYCNASAIGLLLPFGIEQKNIGAIIPASDVSPLGGWGYGWMGWLNNFLFGMSINRHFYQARQPTNNNILTQNAGGVDFMFGYTIQRFEHTQVTPTLEFGLTNYPTYQSNSNPFLHLGASLGVTYSIPFYSGFVTERNVWFDAGALVAFNLGYVQYFSTLDGSAAQSAVIARLRVGLGLDIQRIRSNNSLHQFTNSEK